jgi:RND family efflux transporter MFP subunit
MTEQTLDIQGLALERTPSQKPTKKRHRSWGTRYLVPGGIIIGFLALMLVAAGEEYLPKPKVTVVPVVVTRAEVQQEGTPLFQAAGWVEPRPTPVNVAALTEGVVEKLHVVEGQEVSQGEMIAKLIDVDLKIALREAEATCQLRQAELESAQADLKAAKSRVENPVHLEAALAEAESLLAKSETSLSQLPFFIKSQKAQVKYDQQNLDGKLAAKDAIAGRLIQEAGSILSRSKATLEELQQRLPRLAQEVEANQNKVKALTTQLKLLIEESRQLEDAQARLNAARAKLQQAELVVEKVELALGRTVVRSPIEGRVMKLIAHPGARVMGLDSTAGQSSSTVVSLYNPKMLQVRADVRLEDVPQVQPGQPVEIETASSKDPILGTVLISTSSANIQKNTLEVKVALLNPPPNIRPEMLVTATFLAPPQENSETEASQDYERLLVPESLVQSGDAGASVWIVDAEGRAKLQSVKLGKARKGELIEVVQGIQPTDKLISSGFETLKSGQSVTISGENTTLGMETQRS